MDVLNILDIATEVTASAFTIVVTNLILDQDWFEDEN